MDEKKRKYKKDYPRIWRSRDSKLIHIENMLGSSGIKLKLTASRKDWHLLSRYFVRSIEKAEYDFHESFVCPMAADMEKTLKKSLHKNHDFVVQMKSFTAVLYLLFEYYFENPSRQFNLDFKDNAYAYLRQNIELIRSFSKEYFGGYLSLGSGDPTTYAAYSMQEVFGSLLEYHKIVPFYNLDGNHKRDENSFLWTYIDGGLLLIHQWIQHKSHDFFGGILDLYSDVLPQLQRDHTYNKQILSFFETLMDAILSGINLSLDMMDKTRKKKSMITTKKPGKQPGVARFRPFYGERRVAGFVPQDEKHEHALGLYFLLDEIIPDIFFHSRIVAQK